MQRHVQEPTQTRGVCLRQGHVSICHQERPTDSGMPGKGRQHVCPLLALIAVIVAGAPQDLWVFSCEI